MSKFELASLSTEDKLPELKKRDDFLGFLNKQPPNEWLDPAPDGKSKTMPIGRVEWLLTNIYKEWSIEVLDTYTMFNSLCVNVRVFYKDPVDGTWSHQDGVGAVPAKTSKGAAASDMTKILNDAVQTGLPAAKSFAIKDACDHIGRIFGRDINRKGRFAYTKQFGEEEPDYEDVDYVLNTISKATTQAELTKLLKEVSPQLKLAVQSAIENKLKELRDAAKNG